MKKHSGVLDVYGLCMRKIQVSVCALRIGDTPFHLNDFNAIKSNDSSDLEVDGKVRHHVSIKKKEYESRFITITFEKGDAYPRPTTVYNTEMKDIEENPRNEYQIEMDRQLFLLIDGNTQKIYISNFREKKEVQDRLSKELNKVVFIKNIIDKEEFLNKTTDIGEIFLSAELNLFSATGILSKELADDFHNYGVSIKDIGVSIKFHENTFPEKLKQVISNLFIQQEQKKIDKLIIKGRSDEKFDRIFNAEGVIDKISIDAEENEDGLLDDQQVYLSLISKIKG